MNVPALVPASPYKGLTPFGDSDLDALLFFGRERDAEIVVANLIAARLTVLYGPSGVGKSSMLRAGVARSLRALPERPLVVVFSSWGLDPVGALIAAVADEAGVERAETLLETVERAQSVHGDVYLILDQAEEYFLYHPGDGELEPAFARLVTEPAARSTSCSRCAKTRWRNSTASRLASPTSSATTCGSTGSIATRAAPRSCGRSSATAPWVALRSRSSPCSSTRCSTR